MNLEIYCLLFARMRSSTARIAGAAAGAARSGSLVMGAKYT